jgi:hypothetical protein
LNAVRGSGGERALVTVGPAITARNSSVRWTPLLLPARRGRRGGLYSRAGGGDGEARSNHLPPRRRERLRCGCGVGPGVLRARASGRGPGAVVGVGFGGMAGWHGTRAAWLLGGVMLLGVGGGNRGGGKGKEAVAKSGGHGYGNGNRRRGEKYRSHLKTVTGRKYSRTRGYPTRCAWIRV